MPRALFPSGRKLLLLLALAAVIIGGAWWRQRPPPDPVYEGKRLSVAFFEPRDYGSVGGMRTYFHGFGPEGVTWLVDKLEHGRQPFQHEGSLPFDHAPDWLRHWVPERWGGDRSHSSIDERMNAANVLAKLGPDAAPAIPTLARLLQDRDEGVVGLAADILNRTGPASWPVVREALEHGSATARSGLLQTMAWRIEYDGEPASDAEVASAIEALVKGCHDPDATVRCAAARGIMLCHDRPGRTLLEPADHELVRLLSDESAEVRLEAVIGIGYFGVAAAPAIPRLIELLDDPLPALRKDSAFTLGKVDQSEKRSTARLQGMLHDSDAECRKMAEQVLKGFGL